METIKDVERAGTLANLPPTVVLVKTSSHAARQEAERAIGRSVRTWYNLWSRDPAATSRFLVTVREAEVLRGLASLNRPRNPRDWHPCIATARK